MRLKFSETTPSRICNGIYRRIQNLPDSISWIHSNRSKKNNAIIRKLKNSKKGEVCFLIANGPSLAKMDLTVLKDKNTVGMNRIYLLFDKMNFETKYFVCINELVLGQFSEEIDDLTMQKFLNWRSRNYFKNDNTIFVKDKLSMQDFFSADIDKNISSGGTVTYVALQVIYYLGFKRVIIIGLDHNFSEKGTPNKVEERNQEKDESHFHPDYFPKGVKWQLPDLYRSELAYKMARIAFEKDGREIIDCTVAGKCNVFKKGKLEDYV